MKAILLIIILLSIKIGTLQAQAPWNDDSLYQVTKPSKYALSEIAASDRVISLFFPPDGKDSGIVIYSLREELFLILVNKPDCYEIYKHKQQYRERAEINTSFRLARTIPKPNDTLQKVFDLKSYPKGYVNLSSPFFKNGYTETALLSYDLTIWMDQKRQKYSIVDVPKFVKPTPIPESVTIFLMKELVLTVF